MPTIRFSSPSAASDECTTSDVITLTPNTIWCSNPALFAQYLSSMWRVGDTYFTSAEIEGPMLVIFTCLFGKEGELEVGPFPRVRLVGQYLFDGDEMFARVEHEKWYA